MERLTDREQEILNILKQEPMIAQEELAARLKITRSAAAVHISNLIKKGFVLGRGYVFNEKTGVVVIGSTYLSISGTLETKTGPNSAGGKLTISSGAGVSSIARHLALLNVPTILLTALGRDNYGDQVVQGLNKAGVNTNHILRSKKYETGKAVFLQAKGKPLPDLLIDHGINELLSPGVINQKSHILSNSQYLVFDTSLPPAVASEILKISNEKGIPAAVLPVNYGDLAIVKENLDKIDVLSLTRDELTELTGISVQDQEKGAQAGTSLLRRGLKLLVITFGEQGVYLISEKENVYLPNSPTQVIDTDAAADAIMSGLLYGMLKGFPYRQAMRLALRAAAVANSRNQSDDALEEEDLIGFYKES